VLTDVDAAAGFEGRDVFFSELWAAPEVAGMAGTEAWAGDGAVARYNPRVPEVQAVVISNLPDAASFSSTSFTLSLDSSAFGGAAEGPSAALAPASSALAVKQAIEAFKYPGTVDVSRTATATSVTWRVTFLSVFRICRGRRCHLARDLR